MNNQVFNNVLQLRFKLMFWKPFFDSKHGSILSLHKNSLSETKFSSLKWLLVATTLLLIGHGIYLLSEVRGDDFIISAEVLMWFAVSPLIFVGLFDYRAALLLSIIGTPFFVTPPIPHLFVQGFGDIFALTATISFLMRYRLQVYLLFQNKTHLVLILLPCATLASIIFYLLTSNMLDVNSIKLQISEFAGLSLAVVYSLILASSLQSEKDFRIFIISILIAVVIAMIHGIVSLSMISACIEGLEGTVMSRAGSIGGGFGNPNYFGAWLLLALPICLYLISNVQDSLLKRWFYSLALLFILFLLLLTVSRTVLILMMSVIIIWAIFIKSWINKFKAVIILLLIITFFPTAWQLRFKPCIVLWSEQPTVNYILQINTLAFVLNGVNLNKYFDDKVVIVDQEKTFEPKEKEIESSRNYSLRIELLAIAYEAWKSSPIFGIGPGNLSLMVQDRIGGAYRAHNSLVTHSAEQGIIGLFAWLTFGSMLLIKILNIGSGMVGIQQVKHDYRKYLLLIFLILIISNQFADQYRVIWLWQFVGLMLSPYISGENNQLFSKHKQNINQVVDD